MPLKYAEYAGKNRFSKYFNDYEYWPNFKIDLDEEIGNILKNGFYRVYILNSIRNAKVFFQNSIRRSLTVQILPTVTHYVRTIINSRLFRSVFLHFLQNFFSTWKLLPESNSSPRERSNHTKIIKIHREKPSQILVSLAKVINWDK